MNPNNLLTNILRLGCLLTLMVIVLGAYVRLSDAGLGCPDWPGCYGKLIVPEGSSSQIEEINLVYPERPFEKDKAWKEMLHRYLASVLGFLVLTLTFLSWFKKQFSNIRFFSGILLALVIFQGILGMWTVTLLLKPIIVMLHLLGGLTILSLFYWKLLREQSMNGVFVSAGNNKLLPLVVMGLIVLFCQISLGGWTSSNYAALACPDFPTCQGKWWPKMNFFEGFVLWRELGVDYEGGTLDSAARTAIHVAHRIGAIIAGGIIVYIGLRCTLSNHKYLKMTGIIVLILLITQILLGISNVKFNLPLSIAVAHNGVAALLLLSLVTLLHHCKCDNN